MIDLKSPEYQQAKWQVKINHFTEKGHIINGVMHVGTNYGYEFQFYRKMGIEYFIGFEPLPLAVEAFKTNYPNLATGKEFFFPFALGDREERYRELNQATGDGQNSSFLYPVEPEVFVEKVPVAIRRFDNLVDSISPTLPMDKFDCLVCDVQGMEMQVMQGMGVWLKKFKFLNIECSEKAVYLSSPNAKQVIDWLDVQGFRQDSPIEVHNDIFFIRKDVEDDQD